MRATKLVQALHPMPCVPRLPQATRWLSWYGVGLASAEKLPVVVRIPAGPLGSLKCDPPKSNGRRQKKRVPRLPRKTTVDVRLCHSCHAKRRRM